MNVKNVMSYLILYLPPGWPWQLTELAALDVFDMTTKGHRVLRMFKCLRVFRMVKVGKNLDSYTRNGPISLALIIVFFLALGHIFACFW